MRPLQVLFAIFISGLISTFAIGETDDAACDEFFFQEFPLPYERDNDQHPLPREALSYLSTRHIYWRYHEHVRNSHRFSINNNTYTVVSILGKGSAIVYLVKNALNKIFALKLGSADQIGKLKLAAALGYVVPAIIDHDENGIVLEFIEGVSMSEIRRGEKVGLSEEKIQSIEMRYKELEKMAEYDPGLEELHITDFKSPNVIYEYKNDRLVWIDL